MKGLSILSNRGNNTTFTGKECESYKYDAIVYNLELLIKHRKDGKTPYTTLMKMRIASLIINLK